MILWTGEVAVDRNADCPFRRAAWPGLCAAFTVATLLAGGCARVDSRRAVSARPAAPAKPAPPRTTRAPQAPRVPTLSPPPVRTIELGRSVNGAPLTLEVFGHGGDRVLIFGGIHGSEPTSAALAKSLADHLRINWDLFTGRTIAILAAANPDGLASGRRTNARGIDLNRNFPARNWQQSGRSGRRNGPAPASEPETKAIMRAVEIIRPNRIIAIHSTGDGTHCNNYDGPALQLAQTMARFNRYPVTATMGYPTPGSFGSWAGVDLGIPTITLELPRSNGAARVWQVNSPALMAFIRTHGFQAAR